MNEYQLSFIISTKNRLPFLRILFAHLLPQLQPDEEIVVVDSNSTDGSKEYLQGLLDSKKIHQFISEPDKNQAHGWNKALLMAKGTIIKKLIDDDVFCYEAIRHCKEYMLQNPQTDIIISNDLGSSLNDPESIQQYSRLPQFEKWHNGLIPSFTFGDVHMLIRRTSLALIGLYNTSYVMMDWEYSLRISYLKANIAYYTGYNALSVTHDQTISSQKNTQLIKEQGIRGEAFYEYAGDAAEISYWSKMKIFTGKIIYLQKRLGTSGNQTTPQQDINLIYDNYYTYISALNRSAIFKVLGSR